MRILSPLVLLVACSDYELNKEPDPDPEPTDTEVVDITETESETETEPEPEVCDDETFDGFEASINEDCEKSEETGTFDPIVEWTKSTFTVQPASANVMMAPVVGDLDLDGVPDIVFITYSPGVVRAVSGDGGSELWDYTNGSIQITGGAALGDIDNDGYLEVIAATSSGVVVLEHDGSKKWDGSATSGSIYGTSDNPAVADMDGDGTPEVIMGGQIWSNTGTRLASMTSYGGSRVNVGSTSFAVDLDGDGQQELIAGNKAIDINGNTFYSNSYGDGYVAVADFDGDGEGEVVVSGGGKVRLQDTDGTLIWSQSVSGSSSGGTGPATIADYDGDGEPEVGLAATSTYTVFDTDGTQLWQNRTQDASSGNTGSSVFDFEGDGIAEAVYADETKLWVFAGPDGSTKLSSTQHTNATWLEYPSIADVDGDGQAEIVVANTGTYLGITVFGDKDESWRPGRQIWNQHAYSITNINDDGSIPATPDQNWLSYNNFRSGDLDAGDGIYAADLALAENSLCELECTGMLRVWLHPGNEGAVDIESDVTVELYADSGGSERLVATEIVSGGIVAGEYNESIQFDIEYEDPENWDAMIFRIYSEENECDDSNNELRWEGPFCQ